MTRAELLRHALLRALRKMHAGRQKLRLDEETRWQICWREFSNICAKRRPFSVDPMADAGDDRNHSNHQNR